MNFMIDVKELTCSACGRELENETVIKADMKAQHFCRECAEGITGRSELFTYVNMQDRTAVLALDRDTFEIVLKISGQAAACKNIKEHDGRLYGLNMENNAIIVIELRGNGQLPSPQQLLIDTDDDIYRGALIVAGSNAQAMKRASHTSDRLYIFYKTDQENDAYRNLFAVGDLLRELGESGRRTVYMERCSTDTDDIARLMLADSGYECVYCSGKTKKHENLTVFFSIDFTREQLFEYCRSRIIGQDKELALAVYLVYDFLKKASLGMRTPAINWLLTAPSGMGKTEFFRAVRDYFKAHDIPVPIVQVDLSQITETGFKGKDADRILNTIYDDMPRDKSSIPNGAAICFLDEADKKFVPSYDSNGNNVNASMQSDLLTLIEGAVMEVPGEDATLNTANTMFVFMGSFQELRNKKQENGDALRRIFSNDDGAEEFEDCFYEDIRLEDMISAGLIEELAGRIALSVNFHKLSDEDMKKLITEKARELGKEHGISIKLEPRALEDLMSMAYTNLGVRTPINKLTELIYTALAGYSGTERYDGKREMIVIKSKTSAEIMPQKKATISETAV